MSSKYTYIDSHSHPHDKKYLEFGIDIDKAMNDLKEDGGATIAIGTDYKETERAIIFAKKYENCFATIGIHPADNHLEIFSEEKFEEFLKFGGDKIVGVGECGLDYYYFDLKFKDLIVGGEKGEAFFAAVDTEKNRQKTLFVSQIEFAKKHKLPLVLHGRPTKNSMDAYRDMLDILEKFSGKIGSANFATLTGHAHFFVGNLEIAKRFLDIGFFLSFDGPITFTNGYDSVIEFVPLDKVLIETDSPYASPKKYRGQTNFPIYVKEVAAKIAELKKMSSEEILKVTLENTKKLFKLDI